MNKKYAKENLTYNQKILRSIICDLRNELIGGQENHFLDTDEDKYMKECNPKLYTKQWAVDAIYSMLMCGYGKYVSSSIRNLSLERKHIRFYGKEWVMGLIEDRVEYDYYKNGWAFPNNYLGE